MSSSALRRSLQISKFTMLTQVDLYIYRDCCDPNIKNSGVDVVDKQVAGFSLGGKE